MPVWARSPMRWPGCGATTRRSGMLRPTRILMRPACFGSTACWREPSSAGNRSGHWKRLWRRQSAGIGSGCGARIWLLSAMSRSLRGRGGPCMSGRFEIFETPITGLKVLQRSPIGDARGYLERMFCASELAWLSPRAGNIVQINHTVTARCGTIRGLHFQHPPHSEEKFVSCLQGEVFDVAVDLRRGSPTFLSWHAEVLSAGNHKTMFIPEGFAHGFQTLTPDCGMLYFHTAFHRPDAEGG